MEERVVCLEDFSTVKENTIIGYPVKMERTTITFRGKNNVLFLGDNLSLADTSIEFLGDNSMVFLSSNRHAATRVKLDIYNNSVFYLGKDANTTRPIHVILSEEKHIIIGDDCLFSRDIWFRNGDPHLIYNNKNMRRSNYSRSILVGDHVWIGQNVLISKGTEIGSGSIIGSWSMTAGKRINSNSSWGGSPVKCIKNGIFWRKPSVHAYTAKQTKSSRRYKGSEFIFKDSNDSISLAKLETSIAAVETALERAYLLESLLQDSVSPNRFYLKKKRFKKIKILAKRIKGKFVRILKKVGLK